MPTPPLRVVADGNNALGDTLTRLVTDLFGTLGYDECRINIHKTGRELDIKGKHAFEDRLVVAECKAQEQPVGGSDINKFVGVLDAERRLAGKTQVHGYFVSVSGYKESAREQEEELGNVRMTLLDGSDIVNRISSSNIVVSVTEATEVAGRFVGTTYPDLKFDSVELIAHCTGWLWAVYFSDESFDRFACLVHADGQIIDRQIYSSLAIEDVTILEVPSRTAARDSVAAGIYRDYLSSEYGAITLDGLPVDHEIGSKRFCLEDLYVPLELQALNTATDLQVGEHQQGQSTSRTAREVPSERKTIGAVLAEENCISVLGPPGSGKSTLVKRLAVAYADSERKAGSSDSLPDKDWFPVVIQCRHLGSSSNQPIHKILQDSFLRSERPDLVDDFSRFLGTRLRSGNLLLLVDGLDEIRTASLRVAFASQLRTFVSRYPMIALVLTSREVGFRYVANSVSSICASYRVAEMSNSSISSLVRRWQRHIGGTGTGSEFEASELSDAIIFNDRVRRLAVNPMLLTTLLLVKRWVGQLPRKRTVLYQKAIEVLLMTWNVEGHDPIDLDEALPQLGYAAYRMMKTKVSSISGRELTSLFQDARGDLPELLAYSTLSANGFLGRVEERSSLLVLSGHTLANGEVAPVYEFKHLTFQEYLAAVALVNRWLPREDQDRALYELLEPLLEKEDWSEVVTMAAVLSRREAGLVVEKLIDRTDSYDYGQNESETSVACSNLKSCLADEVPLAPELARRAIVSVIYSDLDRGQPGDLCEECWGGRYYPLLVDAALEGVHDEVGYEIPGEIVQRIAELMGATLPDSTTVLEHIKRGIRDVAFDQRIMAAGLLMTAAYVSDQIDEDDEGEYSGFVAPRLPELRTSLDYVAREIVRGTDEPALTWMQTWAIAWGGPVLSKRPDQVTALRNKLLENWMGDFGDLSYKSGWAFGRIPLVGTCHPSRSKKEIRDFLSEVLERPRSTMVAHAALVAGWCVEGIWSPERLADMALESHERVVAGPNRGYDDESRDLTIGLLKVLGPVGKARIKHPSLYVKRS